MYSIEEIKTRITIFDIAQKLGLRLEGRGTLFRSPFRTDRKPSFSISRDGKLFNDFATGEKGDVIDFYKLATNVDNHRAITEIAEMLLMPLCQLYKKRKKFRTSTRSRTNRAENNKRAISIPKLEWNEPATYRLHEWRGYSPESQRIAYERGVFGFCEYKDQLAWIVKDASGKVAQARRVDGKLWKDDNGGHKAETLRNSDCSIPAGYDPSDDRCFIALCEGSTDLLAAFHFAWINDCSDFITPLAMLGATQRIKSEVLRSFKGKQVLIFPDKDTAGLSALKLWGEQISPYAEKILYFDFSQFRRIDEKPVKDLSDFIAIDPHQWETLRPYTNPYFRLLTERTNDENAS